MTIILTVNEKGQITLPKEMLQHLGIEPGEKIELDLLPHGRAELRATRPKGTFQNLHGFLEGKTNGRVVSIEEINEAAADGWAGLKE